MVTFCHICGIRETCNFTLCAAIVEVGDSTTITSDLNEKKQQRSQTERL